MNAHISAIFRLFASARQHQRAFLARRPHRSFRRTRRRDYTRSLTIPGYVSLTAQTLSVLRRHKKLFIGLVAVYVVCSIVIVNVLAQDTYSLLSDSINQAGSELELGAFYQAGAIFLGVMTSMFTGGDTDSAYGIAQQFIAGMLVILIWLSTVWLLRAVSNKQDVRLRDGLYSSGGPFLATLLLFGLIFVQSLPIIIAVIGYSAAASSAILENTAILMLFWGAAFLLGVLSLYWMTTTAVALIIITLPGMYPMQALRLAGDIVVGRRIRVLLRLMWAVLLIVLTWAIVVIPAILLYELVTQYVSFVANIPLIPLVIVVMGAVSVVWGATYVYMLYRSIVNDNSEPA